MGTISQVTVEALVVCRNSIQWTQEGQPDVIVGKVMQVPCRDIRYDYQDMWAIPQKDSGIFTGCTFELKSGEYLSKPTFDSFTVFRIQDKLTNDYWIIYGTRDDLTTSCDTCCDESAIPMPHVDSEIIIRIATTEVLDIENESGNPYMTFGIPSLGVGQRYFPYGSLNNVAYAPASSSGYSTITALLSFLNSTYTPFVWTKTSDDMTLIATGGSNGDLLGLNVFALMPSA